MISWSPSFQASMSPLRSMMQLPWAPLRATTMHNWLSMARVRMMAFQRSSLKIGDPAKSGPHADRP